MLEIETLDDVDTVGFGIVDRDLCNLLSNLDLQSNSKDVSMMDPTLM